MGFVKDFLITCSGVDRKVLEECPTDVNKYVGIGGTIFFTGLLAFFSAGYAVYTVFDSWLLAAFFGIIWGIMIFNLDRYIVSSMKSRGSWWRDFFVAFPRLLMAVLLAIVISKPLELKIFQKEIDAELIIMEQEVFKKQETELKLRYEQQMQEYKAQLADMQHEILQKTAVRDSLAKAALAEADGTGGSKIRNMGPIYRAKKASADQAQVELDATITRLQPMIEQKRVAIATIDSTMQSEIINLQRKPYNGMAARMEALDRLAEDSQAIWFASWFIMLLFIAIETAPIFVKLISRRSPYDFVLHEREHVFEMANLEHVSLLSNAIRNKVKFDTETGIYRTQKEIEAENDLTEHFLEEKKAAIKSSSIVDWKKPLLGSNPM
ncbi:MAG: DUF4407 domain-containing protein [Saprospiraceae bacterium]|nr:DUF4407 domain-containing protein [Saprospiraceae bacterium]